MTTWWKVTVIPNPLPSLDEINYCLDELSFLLIDNGAASAAIEDPPHISCFVRGSPEELDTFVNALPTDRMTVLDRSEVVDTDWAKGCPEVWQPVRAGAIEIVPVSSATDPRPSSPSALRIIPGQGFGTGHHATTRMILDELSVIATTQMIDVKRVLDIGTGSGILGLAAARCFNCDVDAIDIDDDALANARENAQINRLDHRLRLSTNDLTSFTQPYDLVLANIYSEVLIAMHVEIFRLTRSGGIALLSGLNEIVKPSVLGAYLSSHGWDVLNDRDQDEWSCLVLKRRAV